MLQLKFLQRALRKNRDYTTSLKKIILLVSHIEVPGIFKLEKRVTH